MIEVISFICFRAWYYHLLQSLVRACNKFKIKMQVVCVYTIATGKANAEMHLEAHERAPKCTE